ncbi:hypothetical protein N781_00695 [Pontibacillus halophilus JSM 076056 = DSM 19796]|uniref:DUF2140 family protein n=1 Tax=Pontibacillus halophilus JSM 076056 = DSM 19796 TaxID=1385510 RepID=A0A0A5GRF9_9BACI|nr:YpmS family protein [Pontibacillus halophilus]KGX93755.1 hypothetical protein N781_00695 [Pontibacillus halophilus JSM 076056 = DSM 19796]
MSDSKDKKRNIWKILFLGLAAVNLLIISWFAIFIYVAPAKIQIPTDKAIDQEAAEFTISSTKENLNDLINTYLNDLAGEGNISYSVSLDERVKLSGTIVAFGQEVPLGASFTPDVQRNGDVVLEDMEITVGRLQVPNEKVLDYVKKQYAMPEWVIVNPKDETIYVALTQMETVDNIRVEAEKINLDTNDLAFKVVIPYQTFGIEPTNE